METTDEFEEAYEEYKKVIKDRLSVVSLYSKGIISGKGLDQRLGGMTIYQDRFKEAMEDAIDAAGEVGGDITEMKKRFNYIVESSEDTDFLIEKVKKQYEIVNERRQKRKNRDESRNYMRLFLATRDGGKDLLDVLKDTIYDATKIGGDLNNVKLLNIDLGKIDLA